MCLLFTNGDNLVQHVITDHSKNEQKPTANNRPINGDQLIIMLYLLES